MGGFGSYFSNQAQNAQSNLPQNMQMQDLQGTGGIKAPPQQQQGYAPFPGYGMGGYPGRFAGAYNPMGGFAGGGMSNYGFGGSPFGGYGFPMGNQYGPGSYGGMAGGMGYGGGSGMMGGPQRGYSPMGGGKGGSGGGMAGNMMPGGGYNPMNVVRQDQAAAQAARQRAAADRQKKNQSYWQNLIRMGEREGPNR